MHRKLGHREDYPRLLRGDAAPAGPGGPGLPKEQDERRASVTPGGGYGVAPWVMRSLQGNLCPAKELCTATMEVHLLPS